MEIWPTTLELRSWRQCFVLLLGISTRRCGTTAPRHCCRTRRCTSPACESEIKCLLTLFFMECHVAIRPLSVKASLWTGQRAWAAAASKNAAGKYTMTQPILNCIHVGVPLLWAVVTSTYAMTGRAPCSLPATCALAGSATVTLKDRHPSYQTKQSWKAQIQLSAFAVHHCVVDCRHSCYLSGTVPAVPTRVTLLFASISRSVSW